MINEIDEKIEKLKNSVIGLKIARNCKPSKHKLEVRSQCYNTDLEFDKNADNMIGILIDGIIKHGENKIKDLEVAKSEQKAQIKEELKNSLAKNNSVNKENLNSKTKPNENTVNEDTPKKVRKSRNRKLKRGMITVKDASQLAGISSSTLYKLIKDDSSLIIGIHYIKPTPKSISVYKSAFKKWLNEPEGK